ncbi:hypothetical protein QBC38DRAFT_492129 [Podospora fimiseda]|uniref:Heterokaryon incompatibility domain-containing protein n=1 Tax=Podospora fimiseda TaxID=252190 RepID=A0AAN7BFC4_9PEZI|nr:hypothetical protein QBC38DRAFT_492129 [Podospora fimiseda]
MQTRCQGLSTNIDARMASISWKELPSAFRDAIRIVRTLGCNFIWIDSFCIVQDDTDDWRTQSVSMSQVYSSAYLNLAMSALPNIHGRLFRDCHRASHD